MKSNKFGISSELQDKVTREVVANLFKVEIKNNEGKISIYEVFDKIGISNYANIAAFSLSSRGFYNWFTHRQYGVTPLLVKTGKKTEATVRLATEDELIIAKFAEEFYSKKVNATQLKAGETNNKACSACLAYIKDKLKESNKEELISILPTKKSDFETLTEYLDYLEEQQIIVQDSIDHVKSELTEDDGILSDDERYYYIAPSRQFGLQLVNLGVTKNVQSRMYQHNRGAGPGDFEPIRLFKIKRAFYLEAKIKEKFKEFSRPNICSGSKNEVFTFPTQEYLKQVEEMILESGLVSSIIL